MELLPQPWSSLFRHRRQNRCEFLPNLLPLQFP
jgi:hypothetical protein